MGNTSYCFTDGQIIIVKLYTTTFTDKHETGTALLTITPEEAGGRWISVRYKQVWSSLLSTATHGIRYESFMSSINK